MFLDRTAVIMDGAASMRADHSVAHQGSCAAAAGHPYGAIVQRRAYVAVENEQLIDDVVV